MIRHAKIAHFTKHSVLTNDECSQRQSTLQLSSGIHVKMPWASQLKFGAKIYMQNLFVPVERE